MRFANELVDASEFNFPSREGVRPQELEMAEQLVENLAEPFDPTRYTDEYRANLMRIIKAKMKGKKPKLEGPEEEVPDSGVLDLMSRLRASLEEGAGKRGAVRAKRKSVAAGRKPVKAKKAKTA
jgi:DNA end-binding protein Ku